MVGKRDGDTVSNVRTRARDGALMAERRKLRKVSTSPEKTTPYSIHQLRTRPSRGGGRNAEPNSGSSGSLLTENTTEVTAARCLEGVLADDCSGVSEVIVSGDCDYDDDDDLAAATTSCCSSNVASDDDEKVVKECTTVSSVIVADPEVESGETSSRFEECGKSTRESDGHETATMTTTMTKSTVQIKMPSETEIEDFFVAAEKDLRKRFSDKYNFDIVKDVPLVGRYEWVQIKP